MESTAQINATDLEESMKSKQRPNVIDQNRIHQKAKIDAWKRQQHELRQHELSQIELADRERTRVEVDRQKRERERQKEILRAYHAQKPVESPTPLPVKTKIGPEWKERREKEIQALRERRHALATKSDLADRNRKERLDGMKRSVVDQIDERVNRDPARLFKPTASLEIRMQSSDEVSAGAFTANEARQFFTPGRGSIGTRALPRR
jgi:hypothetical protein